MWLKAAIHGVRRFLQPNPPAVIVVGEQALDVVVVREDAIIAAARSGRPAEHEHSDVHTLYFPTLPVRTFHLHRPIVHEHGDVHVVIPGDNATSVSDVAPQGASPEPPGD